jgi:hypothetical protein
VSISFINPSALQKWVSKLFRSLHVKQEKNLLPLSSGLRNKRIQVCMVSPSTLPHCLLISCCLRPFGLPTVSQI